jgi:hypothetical protein
MLESALERLGETVLYQNDMGDSYEGFGEYLFSLYAPLGFPDLTALAEKSSKDKLTGFFKPMLTDLLFFGSVAEVFMNENYAGSPIVPTQYQGLVAEMQYDNKTSGVAKWLGQLTGMSPMKIDHIMLSNTGFVGKLIKAYTATEIDWLGGYGNQFTTDVAYSNDTMNRFYDKLGDAEVYARSYGDNAEYQAEYKQYQSASSVLSYLNKKARENPEQEREYKLAAIAYAEEFMESGIANNERLNDVFLETGDKSVYPYITFEDNYTKKEEDENGKKKSVKVVMTPAEFMDYVATYNTTIDEVYGELLGAFEDKTEEAKALKKAKDDVREYARSGERSGVVAAIDVGVSASQYYKILFSADADDSGRVGQSEAQSALNKSDLTQKQKAVLYDLFGDWKSNPYSKKYY